MKKFGSVEEYIENLEQWQDGVTKLRKIMLSLGIEETLKWSTPVYVANGKNVVGVIAMKRYFGLWFHQGVLLADKEKVLINAQEGKTRALRQWRFESIKDIKVRLVKQYVLEAVALAEQGKEVKPLRNKPIVVPKELRQAFASHPESKKAFDSLSKSCRREYAEYVSEAKKEETKLRRIDKIIPMILERKGINDKYKR